MNDSVIDYAVECTPAQERARLTKIVDALTEDEVGEVAAGVYQAASRFNLHRRTLHALLAARPITLWWYHKVDCKIAVEAPKVVSTLLYDLPEVLCWISTGNSARNRRETVSR